MLPTFILQKEITADLNGLNSELDINPGSYEPRDTPFTGLRFAIKWAITHDEDIIYCVCGENVTTTLDFEALERIVHDIVPEGINLLYINAKHKKGIAINGDCKIIEGIEEVSSFILAQPAYRFVLSILEGQEELPDMDWLTFLRFIAPHAFAVQVPRPVAMDKVKFHIISPFRNAAPYIRDYLISVRKQVYPHYHIYLIDDCSTDGSSDLVEEASNITKIVNTERKYALQNILDVLLQHDIEDEDVICLVDADDRLPHKYVFSVLRSVYQDKTLLLTYGSMQYLGGYRRFGSPYEPEEFDDVRNSKWKAAHLRTFRYKLFKKFLNHDPGLYHLKDTKGLLLRMPYDMALLFPLMELAEYKQTKFIHTPMYEYRVHENNDQYINRGEQHAGEVEIRGKKPLRSHSFYRH